MKRLAACLLVLIVSILGADETISSYGVRDIVVPIEKGLWSRAYVQKLASEYLRKNGDAKILRVTFGIDKQDLLEAAGMGYVHSLGFCGEYYQPKHPLARLFAMNGNALFSYQESQRIFQPAQEMLLRGGTDPTVFRINQTTYRLLHIWAHGQIGWDLSFYFEALSTPSASEAKQLTENLKSLTRASTIAVRIRTDPFFVDDSAFPRLFPFYTRGRSGLFEWPLHPDPRTYYRAPEINCIVNKLAATDCEAFNSRP